MAPFLQGVFVVIMVERVAVMCSACRRGASDRWPWWSPRAGSQSWGWAM